jgi:hypothetical protein
MKLTMKLNSIGLFSALTLSGCATPLTPAQIASGNYGEYQTQEQCQQKVISYMGARLKDADSARYQFGKCEKKYFPGVVLYAVPRHFGYGIEFSVNAKNSFGGYTGFKKHLIVINNNNILRCIQVVTGKMPAMC